MDTQETFLSSLSPEARKRIEAGLLEIDVIWHNRPHRDESQFLTAERYLALAYDIFAGELLSGRDLSEPLEDTLVRLASDVVIENGWVRWMVKNPEPNESCTERLSKNWVPAVLLERIKSCLLAGRIAKWRAYAIRRKLSPRKTPDELLDEYRTRFYPNLSHEALADEMGIERTRYFKLKKGKRVSTGAYIIVSDFTKISIGDLKPGL